MTNFIEEWLQRQRNRSLAKKEALLRLQARETIQVREYDGEVYLSYNDTPVIKVDDIKTGIADTLNEARAVYVKYMEE